MVARYYLLYIPFSIYPISETYNFLITLTDLCVCVYLCARLHAACEEKAFKKEPVARGVEKVGFRQRSMKRARHGTSEGKNEPWIFLLCRKMSHLLCFFVPSAVLTPDSTLLKILTSQSYLAEEHNMGFVPLQLSNCNEKIGFSLSLTLKNKMDS